MLKSAVDRAHSLRSAPPGIIARSATALQRSLGPAWARDVAFRSPVMLRVWGLHDVLEVLLAAVGREGLYRVLTEHPRIVHVPRAALGERANKVCQVRLGGSR